MEHYLLFIAISALTIASPGQGVIYTVSNASKYGYRGSLVGILGIIIGVLPMAALAITGLGALLAVDHYFLLLIQTLGALYLIYLAMRYFYATRKNNKVNTNLKEASQSRFFTALWLTILNPKPIIFFSALFPQFITTDNNYVVEMSILMLIFMLLIFSIHSLYALSIIYLGANVDRIKHSFIEKASAYAFLIAGLFLLTQSALTLS